MADNENKKTDADGITIEDGKEASKEAETKAEETTQAENTEAENGAAEPEKEAESTETEKAEETEADKTEKEKKKLFGKKEAKPDPKDEKIKELSDRVLRQMAEFDNFRKRTDREKSQMFDNGVKDALEKILPIADNFERGFKGLSEEELATPFAQGMDKTYKQLLTVFDTIGLKPIETVGKEFDPNLHNAIMHEDNPDVGENIITEEYQKGYTYHDTVLRHSMVKVAN